MRKKGGAITFIVIIVILVILFVGFVYPGYFVRMSGKVTGMAVSEKGPTAYWKFENNIKDSAGYNNGINHGSSFGKGKIGNALIVNGIDNYASVSGIETKMFNGTESFTLSAWYMATSKTFAKPDGKQAFFFGGSEGNYGLWVNNLSGNLQLGHLYWIKEQNKPYASVSDSKEIELNKWYHVASTYNKDDKTACLYIDGEFVNCKDTSIYGGITLMQEHSRVNIGGMPQGFTLPAKIDEAKIWNYALSESEIKKEYSGVSEEETSVDETVEETQDETAENSEQEGSVIDRLLSWLRGLFG